jgi:cobalt-zinc-cadmium efflux system outer membrane protein
MRAVQRVIAFAFGLVVAAPPAAAQAPAGASASAAAAAETTVADSTGGAGRGLPGDTLRLADVVAAARATNPALRAARLSADAAAEAVPQSGALPDPQLQLGLMNRPLNGFGASQAMTMNTVQLTQVLPWPGKLGFAEERARRIASAGDRDADEAELELVARVKASYFQLAFMDRALAVMDQTRRLLRGFLQVSSAMYAVGTGLQQDVLQAQVSVARMTEDITVMAQDRVAAAARLNALLGRGATEAVGPLELPAAADSLPSVDSLMVLAAARRPALAAAQQRVLAAAAGYRAARRALYPNLMVGVAYGQRPRFDDMVSLMVGFSVPLWAGSRQLPLRREMQAQQSAAEARARNLYNETFARLAEQRAAASRAAVLSRLYTTAVLPQARASVEAALSAYRVGRVNYLTLVNDQMTVNRYAIESVRLTAQYDSAVAEIEALTGAGVGGGQ